MPTCTEVESRYDISRSFPRAPFQSLPMTTTQEDLVSQTSSLDHPGGSCKTTVTEGRAGELKRDTRENENTGIPNHAGLSSIAQTPTDSFFQMSIY